MYLPSAPSPGKRVEVYVVSNQQYNSVNVYIGDANVSTNYVVVGINQWVVFQNCPGADSFTTSSSSVSNWVVLTPGAPSWNAGSLGTTVNVGSNNLSTTTNGIVYGIGNRLTGNGGVGVSVGYNNTTWSRSICLGFDNNCGATSGLFVGRGHQASSLQDANHSPYLFGQSANDRGRVQSFFLGFADSSGYSQFSKTVLYARISQNTAKTLTADSGAPAGGLLANILNIPVSAAYVLFNIKLIARDKVTGDFASWYISSEPLVLGRNSSGNAYLQPTSPTFTAGPNSSSLSGTLTFNFASSALNAVTPTIAVDTTNQGLNVQVTPANTNASTWYCHIDAMETTL
jgi:hypothetical protein